ncbi:hypothetical protein Gpo141_00009930 [Globisporangium polare]
MVQITPVVAINSLDAEPADDSLSSWCYKLSPARPLPSLDLSISVESRLLSRRNLRRMRKFVRKSKPIGVAAWIALVAYFVSMLAPVGVGRPCALVSFVLWMPAIVASTALLRYDVVRLLLGTYDFWFWSFVNASTYLTLGVVLGDVRALALVAAWSGVQMNICIDANIRAVKVWAILNAFGILNSTITWLSVMLTLIDDVHDVTLVRVRSQELLASAYVSSGLLTIEALVARNVFRQRAVFKKRANKSQIECTSYRVDLILSLCRPRRRQGANPLPAITPALEVGPNVPEYVKTMRFVERVGEIDPRYTLLLKPAISSTGAAASRFSMMLQALGAFAVVATTLSALLEVLEVDDRHFGGYTAPVGQAIACVSTALYCTACALHYQRRLLRALWGSFNFLFLLLQTAFVHLCVCDFSRWRPSACTLMLISWLWVHWLLSLDALPPVMRRKLGLQSKGFVVLVLVLSICSGVGLIHQLIFTQSSLGTYDRVIWEKHTLGMTVSITLAPVFYNCFVTVFVLLVRLLWRVVVNPSNVLLVLDGVVVYENYLRTAKNRLSRRWGSITSRHEQPQQQVQSAPEQRGNEDLRSATPTQAGILL